MVGHAHTLQNKPHNSANIYLKMDGISPFEN